MTKQFFLYSLVSDDEKLLLKDEGFDMKGVTMSTHAAAIVPSPIFLWRFKVALFYLNEDEIILGCSHAVQIGI